MPVELMAVLIATITCPACGTATVETMPIDACRRLYVCPSCDSTIAPKPCDCCVFCSYADTRCPPMQTELS